MIGTLTIIYWPPSLHDVQIDERLRHDRKQELLKQRKHTEDHPQYRNIAIPEIISLNTKYNSHFPQRGTPISDDELSVDSSVGSLPQESSGGLNGPHKFSNEAVSPPPDTAPNIYPEADKPPNNSSVGDTTKEVADTEIQH